MRAILSSCWLLTVAFGNVIVIMVASVKGLTNRRMEFFLFAGLMVLDVFFFFFLASRYTYAEKKEPVARYQTFNITRPPINNH